MTPFDAAFREVQNLVATFQANERHYLSPAYQESEARKDFIDKFFTALGWDVNHDHQKNPFAQEVKVERGVSMHGSQRRADYAFYLAPNFRDVQFYAEAKKPFGDLATADNCFQAIRYGWNSQTPVAVLTDFEQFVTLDCRYKPDIGTAQHRILRKFHYSEYTDNETFACIYHLFSREAIASSSLNNFADTLPKQRGKAVQRGLFKGGYQSIDDTFLEKLDEYRDILARAFKNNNPHLDGDTLTELTQRTIDRLVFIRFLEDKLIHPDNLISNFGDKGTAWQDFIAASRRLDGIYNGIVFKKHAILDAPAFKVNETAFADICKELSHVNSPFDFNTIPIHILGSIYERFLGKVIVATDKRARIEEKPEVRKAGGVYYTPEYIVRYIVENTVGKAIEGKTPNQIAELRFADIACGSGSFLLGVYDCLLRYHGNWFNANPDKAKKAGCVLREDGGWHLSLSQRRQILLNNIYGVDIDNQAVEVSQLSLFLKLLEEETTASAQQYRLDFEQKAILPSLSGNVVCGNSLIGSDIMSGELFEPIEEKKLNPMDYEQRFPEVMKRGGFDAIVGNPPYGADSGAEALAYLRQKYEVAGREVDTYALFMEQSIKLARPNGYLSMIVPTGWYSGARFPALRRFIACKTNPIVFVNLPYDIFADAWVDTTVYAAVKRKEPTSWPRTEKQKVLLKTFPKRHKIQSVSEFGQDTRTTEFAEWFANGGDTFLTYADSRTTALMQRIEKNGVPFATYADIQRGVTPFNLTEKPTHATSLRAFDGSVRRYLIDVGPIRYVRFDDTLAEPKPIRYFQGSRLLIRELISRKFQIQAVKVTSDFVTNKSMQSALPLAGGPDANFLLGCFNSRLLSWFFLQKSNIAQRDDFPKIVLKETRSLPFPKIDLKKAADKSRHDKMVSLVEQMLGAKKQLATAQTDKDKDFYTNKCEAIDQKIDALVYELYGLTPKEIEIVEADEN